MLRKTITYTDFNEVEKTEDYYFNFTESELTNEDLTTAGGLYNTIKAMTDSKDTANIARLFQQIILRSYGEKSPDGKYFRKSAEKADDFLHSAAYDALYMELAQGTDKITDFIIGTLPKKFQDKARLELNKQRAAEVIDAEIVER